KMVFELALRALDFDHAALDVDLNALGDFDGLLSYARHKSPNLTKDLAADFLRLSSLTGHHALGRGDDRDAGAAERPRKRFITRVLAETRAADALDPLDHAQSVVGVL